jgi:hypothetical protein
MSSFFSLSLSLALLILPLPLSAMVDNIFSVLSEHDKSIITHHKNESYIYLGKELSNIVQLITEVGNLDNDRHSPLSELKKHINNGHIIAEYDAIINLIEYMQAIVHKNYNYINKFQAKKLATEIESLIYLINKGHLTVDAQALEVAKTEEENDVSTTKGKRLPPNTIRVQGLLSVNDQTVQNITAVNLSVTDEIVQNSTIGIASIADAIVDNITITTISVTDLIAQTAQITNMSLADGTVTGTLSANDAVIATTVQLQDATTNYVGIQAPSSVSSYTMALPAAAPAVNQVLRGGPTTASNLIWITEGGSIAPAASQTIYVTKYGNDTTGNGSFDTPYLTLSKAIEAANLIASASNPVAIMISSGIYTEDNSSNPLEITVAGVSIVGASPNSVIIQPNTTANNFILIDNTTRIANVTFSSSSPDAIGISLAAGNLSIFTNVHIENFLTGINCAGGASESYGFDLCFFVDNGTALNVNDTRVECNSCTFFGTSVLAGPPANTGVNVTGAAANVVMNGGVVGLCATGMSFVNNSVNTIGDVSFRLNDNDIAQSGSAYMALNGVSFELTNSSTDIDIQVSGAGTIAEIVGCEFNGLSTSSSAQGTSIKVTDGGAVYISGGTMHDYTTAIQVGLSSDTSSTFVNATAVIIHDCTTDIVQNGTTTLNVNASTASSSKISINDSTNVNMAFFDLDDSNALTIGSYANQDTALIQVGTSSSNHPEIQYLSSLYSTEGIGFFNPVATPSSLFVQSSENVNLTAITTTNSDIAGLRLVSDTGVPVGGITALRGWNVNKNGSTAELSFSFQNSDTSDSEPVVSAFTVMQLDGFNNLLQLPTAGTQIVFDGDTNLYRSAANVLKTDDNFIVGTLTPGTVVITDGSTNELSSSVTTATELSYVHGVTSSIQTQINGKVAKAGDTMTGTLQLPAGSATAPSLVFTGSTTTGLSAATANTLSLDTNGVERLKIDGSGNITIDGFSSAGVVHNSSAGLLTTSLIVDGDITAATITNDKLANISSSNTPGDIVVRDGSGNFQANMITLFGTTTNATDVATKAYVDSAISLGLDAHPSCIVVSTTNVALTGLQTIDGVTLVANNRVLLVGQTNEVQNGIWLAQSSAWTSPTDWQTGTEAGAAYVLITEGEDNAGSSWLCNTPTAIIGTDNVTFVEFSLPSATTGNNVGGGSGQVYQSKSGITLNFRTLSVTDSYMSIVTNSDTVGLSTNATSANTANEIVARDGSGNFSAGTITASLTGHASQDLALTGGTLTGAVTVPAGTIAAPSIKFTGSSTGTGISAPTANQLSFDISSSEQMNINSSGVNIAGILSVNDEVMNGTLQIASLSTGVLHSDSSGDITSSLIVDADITAATITNDKLAAISSSNVANDIVVRDGAGNFSAGTITASLTGHASLDLPLTGGTLTGTLQLPAGSTTAPSLVFTGSTTTGLSATSGALSFSTSGAEAMGITPAGVVYIDEFTVAGVVHNDASGNLSSSLIVNADVAANASIIDTKLATISTAGKVANSATTATSSNTPSTIVLRDTNGNFSANSVSFNDAVIQNLTIASVIDNLTITELSATDIVVSGNLSANDEVINGTLQIATLSTGVLHSDSSGDITSSLIVNADVAANASIVDTKLATISTAGKVANSATTATSANTGSAIVARDSSGNFSAGTITASLSGNATTATTATNFSGSLSGDVTGAQSATVVSFVGGQTASAVAAATVKVDAATNLNTANTLVLRDGTGSFAAQEISMNDGVFAGNIILTTEPSTSSAGNILKGSNSFIHDFGTANTFVGLGAGNFSMSGSGNNTVMGNGSLTANTTGAYNTAMGSAALAANTIGIDNTAIGYNALTANTTGTDNTAIGCNALTANATGTSFNTAVGSSALTANTTGFDNTAVGYQALVANVTGSNNIALGYQAGESLVTGSGNIYINADASSSSESSTTRIGTSQTSCFVAGLNTGVSGDAVVVDTTTGQLGITLSSTRFKHNIQDMGEISSNVLKLRPVTFVYNNDLAETEQYGLIAEEVDQHFPTIVAKDEDGLPYTVRYHLLPVLLLNELQKQQATIEEMKKQYVTVETMNNAINNLQQQIQNFIN